MTEAGKTQGTEPATAPATAQPGGPATGAEPAPRKAIIQTLTGRVVGDKMNKTVTVLVERRVQHPIYGKFVTRSSKYHAHDENNEYKVGDLVEIVACRKLAKTKAYKVSRLIEKSRVV